MSEPGPHLVYALLWRGVVPTRAIALGLSENLLAYARARIALRRCERIGKRARAFSMPRLFNKGEIRIGDDFSIGSSLGEVHIETGPDGVITIGDDVAIDYGASIMARTHISIGSGARIGPYCVLSDAPFPDALDRSTRHETRAIIIGENARLGAHVTITPGVRIGERAVISAGTVVTTSVPDDAVVSGNPGRVICVGNDVDPPPPPVSMLRTSAKQGSFPGLTKAKAGRRPDPRRESESSGWR
jgi:acetyltransferase-like isoleucine patch superfamily enzyme